MIQFSLILAWLASLALLLTAPESITTAAFLVSTLCMTLIALFIPQTN